MIVDDDPFCQ